MHLTNYSVNKQNTGYQSNTNVTEQQGHKLSLKTLWSYLTERGIDTNVIWSKITDLIAKTIISAECYINSMIIGNVRRRYCCHELFGFDILLDENLKPWLIEVNVSPSLHSNSQLDVDVKSAMVRDVLNMAGYMLPDKDEISVGPQPPTDWSVYEPSDELCIDRRLWPSQKTPDQRAKHLYYCQRHLESAETILDILTPDDIRILIESVDEQHRRGNFECIFPSATSHKYLKYFEQPRYYNLLLDAWVQKYPGSHPQGVSLLESFCFDAIHLQQPTENPNNQWKNPDINS
jgi:tubulin polyglutamylase TTLL4